MYDTETQNKFIELRSLGNTYDSISKTLNVNKSTLVEWNKLYEKDVLELKKIQFEEIKEKLLTSKKHRIETFSEIFGEVKSQVKEQPVLMSYEKLVMLLMKISQYFDRSEFSDFKMSYFLNQRKKKDNGKMNDEKLFEAEKSFINGK
jgi:hypothetical protein